MYLTIHTLYMGGGGLVIKCYGSYTLLFQCIIGLRYF